MNNVVDKIVEKDGYICFDVQPDTTYNWMIHERPWWLEKAKKTLGEDWYWHNADPIEYKFCSRGWRNNYELEEVSANEEWYLMDLECMSTGPGVDQDEIVASAFEKMTGKPVYSFGTYGGRIEFINLNLLKLSQHWINPPSGFISWMSMNDVGVSANQGGRIKDLDFVGAAITPNDPLYKMWRVYNASGISRWQHIVHFKTQFELCKVLDIPLIHAMIMSEDCINNNHITKDLPPTTLICHDTSVGRNMVIDDNMTWEEKLKYHIKTFVDPVRNTKPQDGVSIRELGRDLLHPSANNHKELAEKIAQTLNLEYEQFGPIDH